MQFYYLINAIVFIRLFFFFRDARITIKKIILLTAIEIVFLLIFKINIQLILLVTILILINLAFYFWENKSLRINLVRSLSLIANIILVSIFTSKAFSIQFNFQFIYQLKNLSEYLFILNFTKDLAWLKFNIILMGILLLLNEANFFIRYFFEVFSLIPKIDNESARHVDEKEFNAGRVIGMLERVLILFFVLVNQYSAIAFIIAAKAFTRFKDLNKREFAEYVLIGTLLSSFIAILISLLIKVLIQ